MSIVKRLALIGASSMGSQIMDYAHQTGLYEVVGFIDDNTSIREFRGLPVLGNCNEITDSYNNNLFDCVFISIGYTWFDVREKIYNEIKGKVPFANIISPLATVREGAVIGEGVLITDGAYISNSAVVEDDVCVTLRSIVNHGCRVKKHTFLSTNVTLAGNITVGEKCFLGVGCVLSDGINICDNTWLTPGVVVLKNIKKPGKYFNLNGKLVSL